MAVEEYRRRAVECLRVMTALTEPQYRAAMLAMADCWARLADLADKNTVVVRAPPLCPEDPPQSK